MLSQKLVRLIRKQKNRISVRYLLPISKFYLNTTVNILVLRVGKVTYILIRNSEKEHRDGWDTSLNPRLSERNCEVIKFNVPKVRIIELLSSKRPQTTRHPNPRKIAILIVEATMRQTGLQHVGLHKK